MKTYEEFNFDFLKKKKYDDYIGLDDIDALDEFNDLVGVRDEYLIKKLLDGDYFRMKKIKSLVSGIDAYRVYLKTFNGDYAFAGLLSIPELHRKLKNGWHFITNFMDNRFRSITPNISGILLKKLNKEQKKAILMCVNEMDYEYYKNIIGRIKNTLRGK